MATIIDTDATGNPAVRIADERTIITPGTLLVQTGSADGIEGPVPVGLAVDARDAPAQNSIQHAGTVIAEGVGFLLGDSSELEIVGSGSALGGGTAIVSPGDNARIVVDGSLTGWDRGIFVVGDFNTVSVSGTVSAGGGISALQSVGSRYSVSGNIFGESFGMQLGPSALATV